MDAPESPVGRFVTNRRVWVNAQTWLCPLGWERWLEVLPGFESDGASIPRLFWSAVGPQYSPKTFPAAYGHDALYASELLPRKDADRIFRRHLRLLGVNAVKASMYYMAVRAAGWVVWRRHTPDRIAAARKLISLIPGTLPAF